MSEHGELVEPIARQMHRRLPPFFPLELADLIHEGHVGLLRAADTYDPKKGNARTWAFTKVIHAIQEAVRGHYEFHVRCDAIDETFEPVATEESIDQDFPAAIVAALALLSQRQRLIIESLYEDSASMNRVRQTLGISWRQLRNEHQDALKRLRPALSRGACSR